MAQVFSPKKITIRDCNLSKKTLEEVAADGQKTVLRFVGVVRDAKEEPGRDGNNPYTVLTGDFIAVNMLTGDQYVGAKAILPEVATYPIVDLLNEGRKIKAEIVKVAVDVAVTHFQPRNPDGLKYKFVASPLIKPSKKTVVQELLEEIGLPPAMIESPRKAAPEANAVAAKDKKK